MMRRFLKLLCLSTVLWTAALQANARDPWTKSRLAGSPEPPLPYTLQPVYEQHRFENPVSIQWETHLKRLAVAELGGRVWTFVPDSGATQKDLLVDLKQELKSFDDQRAGGVGDLYGMAFDPNFQTNRFVYLCFVIRPKQGPPLADGTRVSRFRVTDAVPPKIDIDSELPIIEWLSGGHNGGDLAFDASGCLMISAGDATEPSPPDRLATGQDTSDLLASVLRIDVRNSIKGASYRIPDDNPFTSLKGTRPEIWAYGFRNPWRISVDPASRQLWLGDVGWEKWEMVHQVEKGGNYGWSVREGFELIQPQAAVGPSPILPPKLALPHSESASITGGFVYRGKKLADLYGHYLFGDWVLGRVWSMPIDGSSEHREIASAPIRILAFGQDHDGEALIANHQSNTTLYRLEPNPEYARELELTQSFPLKLSQTGLFVNTSTHQVETGVEHFTIHQPQWMDGALAERYVAFPDDKKLKAYRDAKPLNSIAMFNSRLHYPPGTVFMKTIYWSSPKEFNQPRTSTSTAESSAQERSKAIHAQRAIQAGRRLETQLLHYDGHLWNAYSYLWNEDQTDADLVEKAGKTINQPNLNHQFPDSPKRWRIHSRSECLQCHNPWPETTLAFTPEQLMDSTNPDQSEWNRLAHGGWIDTLDRDNKPLDPRESSRLQLAGPDADLSLRARSYLSANCGHCHMAGAGGAVDLSLRLANDLKVMKAVDIPPAKGTFNVAEAKLISPGHASRSTIAMRMASGAVGRMPHIGSEQVDWHGLALIADWIDALPPDHPDGQSLNGENPSSTDLSWEQFESTVLQLPNSPSPEQCLAVVIQFARLKSKSKSPVEVSQAARVKLKQVSESNDPMVVSLLETLLPASERRERLGQSPRIEQLAAHTGAPERGRELFFSQNDHQCSKCHRIANSGGEIGPDLTKLGSRASRQQIFESLVDPSRVIDPKYQSVTVLMNDGQIITGLIIKEDDQSLHMRNGLGENRVLAKQDIEVRKAATQSLMPNGLISNMTLQQAADLLAYLESLRND